MSLTFLSILFLLGSTVITIFRRHRRMWTKHQALSERVWKTQKTLLKPYAKSQCVPNCGTVFDFPCITFRKIHCKKTTQVHRMINKTGKKGSDKTNRLEMMRIYKIRWRLNEEVWKAIRQAQKGARTLEVYGGISEVQFRRAGNQKDSEMAQTKHKSAFQKDYVINPQKWLLWNYTIPSLCYIPEIVFSQPLHHSNCLQFLSRKPQCAISLLICHLEELSKISATLQSQIRQSAKIFAYSVSLPFIIHSSTWPDMESVSPMICSEIFIMDENHMNSLRLCLVPLTFTYFILIISQQYVDLIQYYWSDHFQFRYREILIRSRTSFPFILLSTSNF